MHTLADLKAGKLHGLTRLTLSENLTTFPEEIFDLADTLEILDLSNNKLTKLPNDMHRLKKLKIAFFSNNLFTEVPRGFKECENLYMLGFKANHIENFDEDILPLGISWLILTDNRLSSLPRSIGKLTKLQKFPVAGNQLTSLPQELSACTNLELIRLSANQLTHIPDWLLRLPKLSWLAFSGNPCVNRPQIDLTELSIDEIETTELLGEGASGRIFKGKSKAFDTPIAVKLFKGAVTSDGFAQDEMHAYMSTGDHPHLIKVLAKIKEQEPLGLVLEYISKDYENLGFPPNFDTCTRDTFTEGETFSVQTVYTIAKAMLSAAKHLHERGLMHGDLYAHNILIRKADDHCYFGDFGAATFYDKNISAFEKIEVRAFGCLIEDLLALVPHKDTPEYKQLHSLAVKCMQEETGKRPLFKAINL